jgi:hypothetical protein
MKNQDNNKSKTNEKFLHGNSARIDPNKKVMPLFEMSATNGSYKGVGIYGNNAFSRAAYSRQDYDEELAIHEVDSNPLS